jgi:uncharacterized coiled-coil protein SlyX
MNETQPPQKQDIDRLKYLLEAILAQLQQLNKQIAWSHRDDPTPPPE